MQTLDILRRKIPQGVRLVGVAKGQPLERIKEAVAEGLEDLGENYAQELARHAAELPQTVRWHFIGHLQKNKVKQVVSVAEWVHSVDSLPLAQEINGRAAAIGKNQKILIEIHLGGEETKTGLPPEAADSLVAQIAPLKNLSLVGLMAMPPYFEDPQKARPFFRQLREIRDAINRKSLYRGPLNELSIGMSHDFEVAIEEGATMVRIGTALFGPRGK